MDLLTTLPTKVVFGLGAEAQVGALVRAQKCKRC